MLIMLQTQTGKGEKRLDPRNRGQTSNNLSNNKKRARKSQTLESKTHPMQYSQANFSYGSVAAARHHVSKWQIFRPFDVCLFAHMLCSSVLLAHVDARVYSKNRLKAKFN